MGKATLSAFSFEASVRMPRTAGGTTLMFDDWGGLTNMMWWILRPDAYRGIENDPAPAASWSQ